MVDKVQVLEGFLFFMLGLASWTPASAYFTQLSIIKNQQPETDRLYAISDLSVQLGNVMPLLFVIFCSQFVTKHTFPLLIVTLLIGIALCVVLSTAWHVTIDNVSVVLIACAWVSGTIGSFSMVTMLPFSASWRGHKLIAISALSTGTGCCGVLTSLMGVGQGVGWAKQVSQLVFSPGVFFALTAMILALSLLSLLGLRIIEIRLRSPTAVNTHHRRLMAEDENQQDDSKSGSDPSIQLGHRQQEGGEFRQAFGGLFISFATCLMNFGIVGLLPFIVPCGNTRDLFWITIAWVSPSLVGRLITTVFTTHNLRVPTLLQFLLLGYWLAVARVQTLRGPHFAAAVLPATFVLMVVYSLLHGFIVTCTYHLFANSSKVSAVVGMVGQVGCMSGSVLCFSLVTLKYVSHTDEMCA